MCRGGIFHGGPFNRQFRSLLQLESGTPSKRADCPKLPIILQRYHQVGRSSSVQLTFNKDLAGILSP